MHFPGFWKESLKAQLISLSKAQNSPAIISRYTKGKILLVTFCSPKNGSASQDFLLFNLLLHSFHGSQMSFKAVYIFKVATPPRPQRVHWLTAELPSNVVNFLLPGMLNCKLDKHVSLLQGGMGLSCWLLESYSKLWCVFSNLWLYDHISKVIAVLLKVISSIAYHTCIFFVFICNRV